VVMGMGVAPVFDVSESTSHQQQCSQKGFRMCYLLFFDRYHLQYDMKNLPVQYIFINYSSDFGGHRIVVSTLACGARNLGSIPSGRINFFGKFPYDFFTLPVHVTLTFLSCFYRYRLRLQSNLFPFRREDSSTYVVM
jgi:hypothetical protein